VSRVLTTRILTKNDQESRNTPQCKRAERQDFEGVRATRCYAWDRMHMRCWPVRKPEHVYYLINHRQARSISSKMTLFGFTCTQQVATIDDTLQPRGSWSQTSSREPLQMDGAGPLAAKAKKNVRVPSSHITGPPFQTGKSPAVPAGGSNGGAFTTPPKT
jgi:hypothetical protein